MGLFDNKNGSMKQSSSSIQPSSPTRVKKPNLLEYDIVVEDINEAEFDRLVAWIEDKDNNIPSSERLYPSKPREWASQPNPLQGLMVATSMGAALSSGGTTDTKFIFKFKRMEQAMSFKLMI
jgi:hypothetical protein